MMEAGGLDVPWQEMQTMCSFLLDLVHDDYSPSYSFSKKPECDVHTHTFCERDTLPSRSEAASIRALGV
jgi:hypothetical protein